VHSALTLDSYGASGLECVTVPQLFVHGVRHLDRPRSGRRLHAARSVDGVTPEIVGKLADTDHAGHERAAVDAHPASARRTQGRRTRACFNEVGRGHVNEKSAVPSSAQYDRATGIASWSDYAMSPGPTLLAPLVASAQH
jgi:hypothetical protein